MYVLAICGSTRKDSTNLQFLKEIEDHLSSVPFKYFQIDLLPSFNPEKENVGFPEIVNYWRQMVGNASQVIICTPEYLHNIPAILKNSLEWLSSSGEMVNKPVIAMTLSPKPPRGQLAMISLLKPPQLVKKQ